MVDIHCHLLPGLDDGCPSLETSLEMAKSAIAEGITHVIATPHANSQFEFIPNLVQLRRDEIQERLGERLQIATGCDFHLSYENLEALRKVPSRFTLNQKSYLLVEFDDFSIPQVLDQALHDLQLQGLCPIITHPERNPLIRAQFERLWSWMRLGCFVQVTAQSLLGGFGEKAQQAAEALLDAGAIHFVASDAHNTTTRPLRLKDAYNFVAARKGEDIARALFQENPLAVFEGRPLPCVTPPAELPANRRGRTGQKPKRRFWFFL
ncbi:MAG TPA: CpsB/CapC family capsule biosynthesis tyrosine phosphatase [Candidatus Acidoferrales bacterium]|nr:CpsB/CapC family capsule biosynthesis tyrosine phosphatase [Candidatus Acidoferrales bacterium]